MDNVAPLRTLRRLLANVDLGIAPTDLDRRYNELHHDSRKVSKDDTFIALRGGQADGHDYILQVAQRGATAVVVAADRVEQTREELSASGFSDIQIIALHSPESSLAQLAGNHFDWPQRHLKICGVTGTNGKSTVAHLVSQVFAAANIAHLRLATTGNWIVDHLEDATHTTPFPIELLGLMARARARGATHVIMEVASHAIVQARIAGLQFDCVALTSFSQDHLDFHKTMEQYLAAKCALAKDYLKDVGVAIAHANDEAGLKFLESARASARTTWRISEDPANKLDLTVLSSVLEVDGVMANLEVFGEEACLRSPLVGAYNLENLMIAVGCARALDIPLATIIDALAHAPGAPGRLERIVTTRSDTPAVFVDYAHTPDAISRALLALAPYCRGQLIIVFGCGGDRDRTKRPLMGAAAVDVADVVWVTSDNPRTENPETIVAEILAGLAQEHKPAKVHVQIDRRTAIEQAIASAQANDVVLIAGKGHEDYQILGTTKIPFSDHEVARAVLNEA